MTPAYAGEVQFRRYSDTSTQGASVTFALPDRAALEAFIGMEGKRFQAVFVEIGDDEQPAKSEKGYVDSNPSEHGKESISEPKEREPLGPLAFWCVLRCKEPEFLKWLSIAALKTVPDEIAAKGFILGYCNIESRRELDTNAAAARRFKAKVMAPFSAWLAKQGSAVTTEGTA